MQGFPKCYTSRLLLRKLEPEDFPLLICHTNNKNISDHILNIPHPYGEPEAAMRMRYIVQGFKEKSRYIFAIIPESDNALIGEISLHIEAAMQAQLAYWIGEPFWNQGFATEAITGILKFGFEKLELESIYATCKETNVGSARVLQKNNFIKSASRGSIEVWSIMKSEWA